MDNILLLSDNEEKPNENRSKPKLFTSSAVFNYFIFGASLIISIVVLIMFFSAADLIKNGGLDIMSIESVGGRTLEEAYYHGLGYVYEGYYVAVRATGVFCSSLLLIFGISRLKSVRR